MEITGYENQVQKVMDELVRPLIKEYATVFEQIYEASKKGEPTELLRKQRKAIGEQIILAKEEAAQRLEQWVETFQSPDKQ